MRMSRWHHYHFTSSNGEGFAVNSDLRLAIKNLHNGIERGGMFTKTLSCIEREDAYASIGIFYKFTTDNSAGGIIYNVSQLHYFF